MATDPLKNMTPDIYDLASYVNELKKEYNEGVSEDTLMVGIYGLIGELFSNIAQNDIIMASEFANEAIPTKAKFEKNVISHALNLKIENLNAAPAQMDVFLTFIEDEIINAIGQSGSGEFTFDCDNKIYFGNYEFHPDYDIIIKRIKLSNGSYTYTAMYDMDGEDIFENPISDITNPYLTPPVVMNVNGTRYLFTSCTLRQVEKSTLYKKVLTDNTIASKTTNFEFSSQLAGFTVDVSNSYETVHLVPVYEGLVNSNSKYPYVWYTYLDSNNIRIKFDGNSYSPRVNSDVKINLMTTKGESGNFEWASENYPFFSFDSERLGYNNITVQVRPINGESLYGIDKKSIDDVRKVIAVEALARGSVTNTTDLQNYFNAIDSDISKMYFYKKRDNAKDRLYYSYIVMKDAINNIVPTNTTDLLLDPAYLQADNSSSKLVLKRGQILKLSPTGNYATVCEPEDISSYDDGFYYVIPYNFAVSVDPMYGMYFLSNMNTTNNLEFTYINEECQYQYISTYIKWNRQYLTDPDTYTLTLTTEQNLTDDDSMIKVITPAEGEPYIESKVKAFLVLYSSEGEPYRWTEASIVNYDGSAKIITYAFTMKSEDYIDNDNNIRIEGPYQIGDDGSTTVDYGYLPANCRAMIHIVTQQPEYSTNKKFTDINANTNTDITKLIPTIEDDWCITNSYNIINGLNFFYNFSEIIYSTVDAIQSSEEGIPYMYKVSNVPMIKYNYFKSEDMVDFFFGELIRRKYYIDEALNYIEDSFGMNFKFFNTYGPSKMFTLDNDEGYLNRVNISLIFRIALQPNYDENILTYIRDDIKSIVDGINDISSLHIPNIITSITTKYRDSLTFFEFIDMNGYGPGEQHLFSKQMPDDVRTPELININTLDDQTPDITITIA